MSLSFEGRRGARWPLGFLGFLRGFWVFSGFCWFLWPHSSFLKQKRRMAISTFSSLERKKSWPTQDKRGMPTSLPLLLSRKRDNGHLLLYPKGRGEWLPPSSPLTQKETMATSFRLLRKRRTGTSLLLFLRETGHWPPPCFSEVKTRMTTSPLLLPKRGGDNGPPSFLKGDRSMTTSLLIASSRGRNNGQLKTKGECPPPSPFFFKEEETMASYFPIWRERQWLPPPSS